MAVGTGAAIVGGALIGAGGSYLAGKEQRKGAEAGAAATLQASREAREAYEPFRQAGMGALPELQRLAAERGGNRYLPYLENMVFGRSIPSGGATTATQPYAANMGVPATPQMGGAPIADGGVPATPQWGGGRPGPGGKVSRLLARRDAAAPQEVISPAAPPMAPAPQMGGGESGAFDIQTSPLYQFQLEKGTEAIRKSAAARGGYASGAAMQSEADLAQRLGAEETNMMYGRLMDLYNIGQQQGAQQYGRTLDLTKIGAGAAGQAGAASLATGQQLANIAGQRGQAGAQMYSNIANVGMAGVGAYQQQRGYQDLMGRMDESAYRAGGGYGPYQY